MGVSPRLESSIKEYLSPVLRADGFVGSGRNFRRVVGELIHAVNVQGSRYGGQFAINLGIHPLGIPDVMGGTPDPRKITESLCEFRRRLAESGSDQWWAHDDSADGMEAAVRSATAVYASVGRRLFTELSGPESPLYTITPVQLESGDYNLAGFYSGKVRLALALARLRLAREQVKVAKAFAEIGLANVGPAIALRMELAKIAGLSAFNEI